LGQRAGLLYRLERSEESLDALQRASALPSMEPQVLASMFLRQAYLSSARGERERAAELDQRARAVDLENARDELAAQVEAEIGMSELRASRFREARNRFESSLGLARRSGDAFAIWDAHIGLAHVDLMEGSSYRALEAITPLLERSLELEDARRQTQALELAATIYERVGSFDRALVLYRLVLSGTELQGDVGRRALTIGNIALVEMRLGLEASALAHAEQAVRLAPRARDRRLETGLLQALGAALAGTGRFAQARLVYERALVSSQHLESPELTGLLYSGLGRVLLALGESELAAHRFRDALGVDAEGSRLVRLQALSGLALTEWRRGQLREALALFDSSLELVESFRRSIVSESDRLHYQETRFTIYANLTGVLTELDERYPEAGYGERAFELVERSRARALRDVLERSVGETSPPLLELGATSSTAASELLKASEVLLEYVLGDERSTLWVITRDGWAHHTLPPRAVIEREVIRYLKTLRAPPRSPSNPFDAHLEPSALLYKLLVEPAAAHWVDGQHLIIAPHGVLHHLPFEALGAPAAGGELRYLVESHNVTYIPSLSVLGGLSRRLAGPRGSDGAGVDFVGFAQSSPRLALALPQGVLPSIPFADAEIQAASGSFSPGRFRLFPTRVANEASLKQELAAHHRIVHIAAHALADRSRPERSAIFVGADELEREDGVLSMREVTALSVGARLVVLSGCETGLGRVMEIEGTLGFTWAFLSAGASSVGVSLWNVNDRASAEVMERFYSGVGAGRPLAEALANAKRQMLQSTRRAYRHPYFWAPMIVVGLDAALEIDR
jgi:CHAT domain-containing protein/Tfp pilus assembly protein PilF